MTEKIQTIGAEARTHLREDLKNQTLTTRLELRYDWGSNIKAVLLQVIK